MGRDGDYVLELASTVNRMFAAGRTDPSAKEIAHEHFGEDKTLGKEIIEGVRGRLSRIGKVVAEVYGHQVCPLSLTYYARFRHQLPLTSADRLRCLPVGHAKRQEGLLKLEGPDDLLWQEWRKLAFNQGGGKVKRSADEVLMAVEAGRLSASDAAQMLADGFKGALPEDQALAARVMAALPPDESDNALPGLGSTE